MRNATSREPPEGAPAELQAARRGCTELVPQVEGVAEQVVAALRQATQELHRLEAQRDELRRTAREAPAPVLPKLLERIEEQGACVRRLERASRGLKELHSGLMGVGEHLQHALVHENQERHEHEAILREEKRMWLRELLSLRHRLEEAEAAGGRARAEPEEASLWRAERERLTQRVGELERQLSARDETLQAKEQTLADLRRMIVLLTPTASPTTTATPAPTVERMPSVPPLSAVVAVPPLPAVAAVPPLPVETTPARSRPALKTSEQLFGNNTIQLAHHLLETLGPDDSPPWPEHRPASREFRFGPLDEFGAGPPATPPPVPHGMLVSAGAFTATPPPTMPKAGARLSASARTPTGGAPPSAAPERPGTLVISEDMFKDVLAEELEPGHPGRK